MGMYFDQGPALQVAIKLTARLKPFHQELAACRGEKEDEVCNSASGVLAVVRAYQVSATLILYQTMPSSLK